MASIGARLCERASSLVGQKIRVGIIGTGNMAFHHVDQYAKIEGVEVVSCFDVDPDKARSFADKHSVRYVAKNTQELLSAVDAVSIVTPDRYHGAQCMEAFSAGKHVLCEKPLTLTLAEAREVAEAAQRA